MYQLLIVCPREFRSACEVYARFKRSLGITCLVYPYEGGRERIANLPFLQELQIAPEQLTEPAACLKVDLVRYYIATRTRYVLLAGDADRIPVPWFEFMQSGNRYFYPTDLYYADLFQNRGGQLTFQTWDPDRDSVKGEFRASQISPIDWTPDLSVGRIPASSAAELETAFTRLMNRSARSPRCLVLRGNDPAGLTPWLEQVSNEAVQLLKGRGYSVTKFFIDPNASPSTARSTLDQVHSHLQRGVEYLFWFGHGMREGWPRFGPYTLLFSEEVPKVGGSPIVFSMSCEVGAYTGGIYESQYFAGGVLTSPPISGSAQVPAVPDALQPTPSTLGRDFAPEEWFVRHERGATALIAGHSWGSLGSDYLSTQPLDFIRMLSRQSGLSQSVGRAFNLMLQNYLSRYKQKLPTDEAALNHLLRIHLFGDPTTPLFC